VSSSSFDSFLIACALTTIAHHQWSSLVPLDAHFPLLTTCVHSLATCASHNNFLVGYCIWSRFFIFSTHHNQCTSITSWFVVDDCFLILGLICYCWSSFRSLKSYLHKVFFSLFFIDCLLLFFLWVVSTHVLFCLVLLMDGFCPWFLYIGCYFNEQATSLEMFLNYPIHGFWMHVITTWFCKLNQLFFFNWKDFIKMRNSKFNKEGTLEVFSRQKWGTRKKKNHDIHIFDFHCVAEDIQGWLKIWLNLHRDDCHFIYIFLCTIFSLATNTIPKKHWN